MLSRIHSNNSSQKKSGDPPLSKGQSTQRDSIVEHKKSASERHESPEKVSWKATGQDNNDIWNDLLLSKSYGTSHWEDLSNHILHRRQNWSSRNQNVISDVMGKKSLAVHTHAHHHSKSEMKLPDPPSDTPNDRVLKDLDAALIKRSLYCFFCWAVVPVGSSRISCRSCSSIAHTTCYDQHLEKSHLPNINSSDASNIINVDDSDECSSRNSWRCPECLDEMNVTSEYFRSKHEMKVSLYTQAKATMRIQTFCRMMVHRIRFKRLIIGIVSMQRIFRNTRNRMRDAIHNVHKLRPFRIRLHTIRGLVHESSTVHLDDVNEMPITLPEMIFYGDIKSSTYDINFGYASRNISLSDANKSGDIIEENNVSRKESIPNKSKLEKLNLSQSMASPAMSPNLSPKKASIHQLDPIKQATSYDIPHSINLMELLRQGCTYQPSYALPSKTVQIYPSGQMMLTIAIYSLKAHHAANSNSQDSSESSYKYQVLHRIDIPLKKTLKNEKLSIPMLQSFGIDTNELSASTLEKLLTEYSFSEFAPSRSYLLLPACTAHIMVKMYLAQVTDWPQAIIVGKLSKNIKDSLIWKRTASYQYSLSDCQWIDVPASDEYNKMVLHVRKPKVNKAYSSMTKKSKASNLNSRLTEATVSSVSNQKSIVTIKHEKGQYFANALVAWSVIPFNDDGENIAGMIEVRSLFDSNQSFHKSWCVIQDRMMFLFTNTTDIHPATVIDIRTAVVSPEDGGIIRIRNTYNESWLMKCINIEDTIQWFRKIYSQSSSNSLKPYIQVIRALSNNIKSKQGDFGAFVNDALYHSMLESFVSPVGTPSSVSNMNTSRSMNTSRFQSFRRRRSSLIKAEELVKTLVQHL